MFFCLNLANIRKFPSWIDFNRFSFRIVFVYDLTHFCTKLTRCWTEMSYISLNRNCSFIIFHLLYVFGEEIGRPIRSIGCRLSHDEVRWSRDVIRFPISEFMIVGKKGKEIIFRFLGLYFGCLFPDWLSVVDLLIGTYYWHYLRRRHWGIFCSLFVGLCF